jgi:hypothetical protein
MLRRQREQVLDARRRIDNELLAATEMHGRTLSVAGLARLQHLIGRTLNQMGVHDERHARVDGTIRCTIQRMPGQDCEVHCPDGTLTLSDLWVTLSQAENEADDAGPTDDAALTRPGGIGGR